MLFFLVFAIGEFVITKREANIAAHRLGKAGVHHHMDRVWLNSVPEFVLDVTSTDCC
jgi:hypothetical protein